VSITKWSVCGFAFLLLRIGHAEAQTAVPDTGYSKSFRCPESMPTKAARDEAALDFVTWAQQAHPEWTITQFVTYRMSLLQQHHCTATLQHIKAKSDSLPVTPARAPAYMLNPRFASRLGRIASGQGSHATARASQSRSFTASLT
jgi:hypothetical protein